MSDRIQAFRAAIGLRQLTDAEARQLHLRRIRAGKASAGNVITVLAERADRLRKRPPDEGAPEHP